MYKVGDEQQEDEQEEEVVYLEATSRSPDDVSYCYLD
jgi:hypothetical protein